MYVYVCICIYYICIHTYTVIYCLHMHRASIPLTIPVQSPVELLHNRCEGVQSPPGKAPLHGLNQSWGLNQHGWGTQEWMVSWKKPKWSKWMKIGGAPISGNHQVCVLVYKPNDYT